MIFLVAECVAEAVIVDEGIEIGKANNHLSLTTDSVRLAFRSICVDPYFNSDVAVLLLQTQKDFLFVHFKKTIKLMKVNSSFDDRLARTGTSVWRWIDG